MNYVVNYDDTDKIDYYGNYKINMDIINEMNLTCVCGIVGLYKIVCMIIRVGIDNTTPGC